MGDQGENQKPPRRLNVRRHAKFATAAFFAAALAAALAGSSFSQSFLPVYKNGSGRFVVDYELGGDIEREDFFNRPIDIALDSLGNLFVLDYKEGCVKKFSSDGTFIKTFGRKGEGPGEMSSPSSMEIGAGDRIVVYDWGNQRFTTFDGDGEVLGTQSASRMGWAFVFGFRIARTGQCVIETRESDFHAADPPTKTIVSRIDLGTMNATTIDSILVRDSYYIHSGTTTTTVRAPFYEGPIWGVTSSGEIVIANPTDYSITFYSPDLTVVRRVRHECERRKVTDKDKEEYFRDWDEDMLLRLKNKVEFPKYKTFFEALLVDDEGYLLFLVDEPTRDTQLYDVFTPEGVFLNRVTLPRLSRSAILTGKHIYTIARGEQDPVVRRYRLE